MNNEKIKKPEMYASRKAYLEAIRESYESFQNKKNDSFPKDLQYFVEEILLNQLKYIKLKALLKEEVYDVRGVAEIIEKTTIEREFLQNLFANEGHLEKEKTELYEDFLSAYGLAKTFREYFEQILSDEEDEGSFYLDWLIENFQYSTILLEMTKEKISTELCLYVEGNLPEFRKMLGEFTELEVKRVITHFFGEILH